MTISPFKLGSGMLASGPILITHSGSKPLWWIGNVFLVLGPILMAFGKTK
jgi:hypothetical protein